MPSGCLFFLLCFLYCTWLVGSVPAGRFGQHPNAGLGNSPKNITSTLALPSQLNTSNSDPIICHVGNTRTILIIRLLDIHPLEPIAMRLTLEAAKAYADRKIKVEGDGWLPHSKDPFRFDIDIGISVAARSRPDQHLTWGILSSAIRGLQECLFPNDWYEEGNFQIYDSDWGHVGDGRLTGYRQAFRLKEPPRTGDMLDQES